MYALEIMLAVVLLAFLAAQVSRRIPKTAALALGGAGLLAIALSAALGQTRLQMAPAYLLWVFLALSLLIPRAHAIFRSTGAILGVVLLASGVWLSLTLPIVRLPAPDGPYTVGTTSLTLVDPSRKEAMFGAPESDRLLYLQLWYPGALPEDGPRPRSRTLWRELYRGDQDLYALIFGYLRGVKTHSYQDVPPAAEDEPFPLILFSHGLYSIAEQNTLLMEHLASHGYVVAAVGHTYMSARVVTSDGGSIDLAFAAIDAAGDRYDGDEEDIDLRIERAASAEERERLTMEDLESSTGFNDLMSIWVDDLRFVADVLARPSLPAELEAFAGRVGRDRIGFLGMSFGGGAVAEVCKIDARCAAGLNLDGDYYGSHQRQPLQVPFLMMVHEGSEGINAFTLRTSESDYYELTVAGATHPDFLDLTVVTPYMPGEVPGDRMIDIVNAASLSFFDAYLRDGPGPRFDTDAYPELTVVTNDRARGRAGE
jgi:predicted dienelactone hydrolase